MAAAAALSLGFTACSPDEFEGADPNARPTMDGVDFIPSVDQETNTVTVTFEKEGCYPVWNIDGVYYSSLPTMAWSNTEAGEHTIELRLGNRNGFSDKSIKKTFKFDKDQVDYSPIFKRLCDKEWRIDYDEVGHMGCGESGTDGSGWWAAAPADKKDWGVYDDRITFSDPGLKGGTYTYNPGAGGTVYCNKDVATYGQFNTNDGNDYMAKVDAQTTTFTIETDTWTNKDGVSEKVNYLVFPAGTLLPYVPNDAALNENNRWRIEDIKATRLALVNDLAGSIAWRLVFTTKPEAQAFGGFTYDQADNLWKNATVTAGGMYYADANWTPYPDVVQNDVFKVTNQSVTVSLPKATNSEWQAQFPLVTDIKPGGVMSSSKTYDFSCVLTSTKAQRVTLKLVETGDNGVPGSLGINYDANAVFYVNNINLEPNVPYVFYLVDQQGIDIQDHELQLVMDFGGCEAENEVTVENIVLIDHAKNTELDKVPTDQPGEGGEDKPQIDWKEGANLLAGMPIDVTTYYAHGGSWEGYPDPVHSEADGVYKISLPGASDQQWQAQYTFHNTGVQLSAAKKYDVRVVIESNNEFDGATIKFTQEDNDDVYITADRHHINEGVNVFEFAALEGKDISNLKIVYDFGGNPADTEITISDVRLQEATVLAYDDPNNLWAKANVTMDWWYSPADWSGGLDPVVDLSQAPRQYTLTMPDGIGGGEWMGQTKFHTDIAASASKTYNFAVTLVSEEACTATIKLAWEGNDNDHAFFYVNDVNLEADKEFQFKQLNVSPDVDYDKVVLFVDLGRTPAGAKVVIKDFVLVEN